MYKYKVKVLKYIKYTLSLSFSPSLSFRNLTIISVHYFVIKRVFIYLKCYMYMY